MERATRTLRFFNLNQCRTDWASPPAEVPGGETSKRRGIWDEKETGEFKKHVKEMWPEVRLDPGFDTIDMGINLAEFDLVAIVGTIAG